MQHYIVVILSDLVLPSCVEGVTASNTIIYTSHFLSFFTSMPSNLPSPPYIGVILTFSRSPIKYAKLITTTQ